jgi:hypothetical protein
MRRGVWMGAQAVLDGKEAEAGKVLEDVGSGAGIFEQCLQDARVFFFKEEALDVGRNVGRGGKGGANERVGIRGEFPDEVREGRGGGEARTDGFGGVCGEAFLKGGRGLRVRGENGKEMLVGAAGEPFDNLRIDARPFGDIPGDGHARGAFFQKKPGDAAEERGVERLGAQAIIGKHGGERLVDIAVQAGGEREDGFVRKTNGAAVSAAGVADLMLEELEADFRAGVAHDLMKRDSEGVARGTAEAEGEALGIDEMRGGVELWLREEMLIKRELDLDGEVLLRGTGFREFPEGDDGVFENGRDVFFPEDLEEFGRGGGIASEGGEEGGISLRSFIDFDEQVGMRAGIGRDFEQLGFGRHFIRREVFPGYRDFGFNHGESLQGGVSQYQPQRGGKTAGEAVFFWNYFWVLREERTRLPHPASTSTGS